MPELRTFIAIELPEAVREMLARTQQAVSRASGRRAVRWVQPAGIHLTLKFLGNVPDTGVLAIVQALQIAAAAQRPLALHTTGLGSFPPQGAVRVVWVGVGGDTAALATLQQRVEQALVPLGYAPEGRAFAPHLTLGRGRDDATADDIRTVRTALARATVAEQLPIAVASLTLFESRLQPGGAVYHPLAHIPLSQLSSSNG